jgi:membrane protein implicated in regulation of membrane protease activity
VTFLEWTLVAIVCGAIEILSAGFWFLWLAIAAIIVAFLVQFGLLPTLETQLLVFAIFTSGIYRVDPSPGNEIYQIQRYCQQVKALIGQHGMTLTSVSPLHYGQVKVNGEIWTAVSEEDIDDDTRIEVTGIDGVKLRVKKADPQL